MGETVLLDDRELDVIKLNAVDDRTSSRHSQKPLKSSLKKFPPKSILDRDNEDYRRDKSTNRAKRKHDGSDGGESLKCDRKKEKKRHSAQPRRSAYVCITSSDDDCVEITKREELQAALNVKTKQSDGLSSSLEQKLNVGKRNESKSVKRKASKSHSKADEPSISKKTHTKCKKTQKEKESVRKRSNYASLLTTSKEVSEFFYTLQEEKVFDIDFYEIEAIDKPRDRTPVRKSPSDHIPDDEDDDDDDENVSLEEQELRLIALKSAVLKKHEARKKRRLAMDERPYSPTDNILTPERVSISDTEQVPIVDVIDLEGQNMEISPATSPSAMQICPTNKALECETMDMDLAHSDDSRSPVFFYEKTQASNEMISGDSMPSQKSSGELNQTDGSSQNPLSPSISSSTASSNSLSPTIDHIPVLEQKALEEEEETALRALLIAKLKNGLKNEASNVKSQTQQPRCESPAAITNNTPNHEDINADESLEADCLRSFLLSSIRNKKANKPESDVAPASPPIITSECSLNEVNIGPAVSVSMPELESNLKMALKRIQSQKKPISANEIAVSNSEPRTEFESVIQRNKSDISKPEKRSLLKTLCTKLAFSNARLDGRQNPPMDLPSEPCEIETFDWSEEVSNGPILTHNDDYRNVDQEQENSNIGPIAASKTSPATNVLTPANKLTVPKAPSKGLSKNETNKTTEERAIHSTQANHVAIETNSIIKNSLNSERLDERPTEVTENERIISPVPAKNASDIQISMTITTTQTLSLCSEVPLTQPTESTDNSLPTSPVPASLTPQLTNSAARKPAAKPNLILCSQKTIKARRIEIESIQKTNPPAGTATAIENKSRSPAMKTSSPKAAANLIRKPSPTVSAASKPTATASEKGQLLPKTKPPLSKPLMKLIPKPSPTINKPIAISADKRQSLIKIKAPSSKVILVADPKPVQKLIIPINQSETSSETDNDEDDEVASFNRCNISSQFDNTSPVSLAMGSPAVCSPAIDLLMLNESSNNPNGDSSQVPEKETESSNVASISRNESTMNSFQIKLDEYLKSVRANVSKDVPAITSKEQTTKVPTPTSKPMVKKRIPVTAPKPEQTASVSHNIYNP